MIDFLRLVGLTSTHLVQMCVSLANGSLKTE